MFRSPRPEKPPNHHEIDINCSPTVTSVQRGAEMREARPDAGTEGGVATFYAATSWGSFLAAFLDFFGFVGAETFREVVSASENFLVPFPVT